MLNRHRLVSILLFALMAAVGFFLADRFYPVREAQAETPASTNVYEDLKIFSRVLGKVQDLYVEEVDTSRLIEGAIQGMLQTLDPHSSYLPPDLYQELQIDTEGSFGGLGIEIAMEQGVLRVISPIDDTPAYRAGILAGDRIVKIDGKETKDIALMEAVKLMRGPKGTSVTLTIWREGFEDLKDFAITRDIIALKSIREAHLIEDGYAYVRISNFQKDTNTDLEKALAQMGKSAPKGTLGGVILDLRNNPGGLLTEAVAVSDVFIDQGLIVYTQGRTDGSREEFFANRKSYEELPLVVLVNEGSASASEIVAGAVQDHKRGIVIGARTFGKGSVQHIIPIEDPSGDAAKTAAVKLTIARYYTPSGRSIQETGIVPDIVVNEEEWVRNREAEEKRTLREQDLGGHLKNEKQSVPESQPEEPKPSESVGKASTPQERDAQDYLLQRGLEILKGWSILSRRVSQP